MGGDRPLGAGGHRAGACAPQDEKVRVVVDSGGRKRRRAAWRDRCLVLREGRPTADHQDENWQRVIVLRLCLRGRQDPLVACMGSRNAADSRLTQSQHRSAGVHPDPVPLVAAGPTAQRHRERGRLSRRDLSRHLRPLVPAVHRRGDGADGQQQEREDQRDHGGGSPVNREGPAARARCRNMVARACHSENARRSGRVGVGPSEPYTSALSAPPPPTAFRRWST